MTGLLHAHSGLRYLVLLAGVVAIGHYTFALATGRPAGKSTRIVGSVFMGLFDTQVLIGLILVAMGRFYPQLWGHLAMMLLAAAQGHVLLVMNRKKAQPGNLLPLIAVTVAMALAIGGIFAIGRGPLTMTVGKASAQTSEAARAEAKTIFANRCATCHGLTGKGDGPAGAGIKPPLRDLGDPAWQASVTDDAIEKVIVQGGAALGKNLMMIPNPDLADKPVLKALREHVRGLKR